MKLGLILNETPLEIGGPDVIYSPQRNSLEARTRELQLASRTRLSEHRVEGWRPIRARQRALSASHCVFGHV